MEDGNKAWDVYGSLEVDENGIPIIAASSSAEDVTNEEPLQKSIAFHRNGDLSEYKGNAQRKIYNDDYKSITLPPSLKLNLPNEVVGIIKNGVKSTISFNISLEIDMIPESIIDFLSASYNIQKEDVVKDIVELSFDEDSAKEILSRGIIQELWKEE